MNEWLNPTPIAKIVIDRWVKDLDAAAAELSRRYDLDEWRITELKPPLLTDAEFRGEPVELDMLAAMTEIGPLALELLQVRSGSPAVMRWAEEMEDGQWHPCCYSATVEQAETSFAEFQRRGFEVVLSGRVAGSRFFMMDADDLLGRMFEVAGGDLSTIAFEGGGS